MNTKSDFARLFGKVVPILLLTPFILASMGIAQAQSQNDSLWNVIRQYECRCSTDNQKSPGRYAPPISTFTDYEEFRAYTDWDFVNGEAGYKGMYQLHRYDEVFELFAMSPIVLVHPNKAFTLNLTPCANSNDFYFLKAYINTESIKNYETFDYSARSYFYRFYHYNYRSDLKEFIVSEMQYRPLDTVNATLSDINNRYGLSIDRADSLGDEGEYVDYIVDTLVQELESTGTNLAEFTLEYFILTDTAFHRINEEEASKLSRIFRQMTSLESIDRVNRRYIHPQYYVSIETEIAGIELDPGILKPSDPEKDRSQILIEFKGNNFAYNDGLEFPSFIPDLKAVCVTPSQLAGTGIGVQFSSAVLLARHPLREDDIRRSHYPLLVTDTTGRWPVYDTLLTRFAGLKVPEAEINLSLRGTTLSLKGRDLLLSNHLAAGRIEMECRFTDEDIIATGSLELSLDDLKSELLSMGLDQVLIHKKEHAVEIHFVMLHKD